MIHQQAFIEGLLCAGHGARFKQGKRHRLALRCQRACGTGWKGAGIEGLLCETWQRPRSLLGTWQSICIQNVI